MYANVSRGCTTADLLIHTKRGLFIPLLLFQIIISLLLFQVLVSNLVSILVRQFYRETLTFKDFL